MIASALLHIVCVDTKTLKPKAIPDWLFIDWWPYDWWKTIKLCKTAEPIAWE
jgi:hypothetical protein